MKKFLFILPVILLFIFITPSQTQAFSPRIDVNQDGFVNSVDAMLILRYSLSFDMNGTSWSTSPKVGDANCDGSTNFQDAQLLLMNSIGLNILPICDAFYVSSQNGSDTNDGSISSPWKTIEHGVSNLQAGQTLYIREGTYKERFSISNIQGTQVDPITISGYPGEAFPIIDGENLVPTTWHTLLSFENSNNIIFKNIKVMNSRGTGIRIDNNSNHITFDNISINSTGYDGIESSGNYLTIQNSKFWNTNLVNDINGPWYEEGMWGGAIMASGDSDENTPPAHDVIIKNNKIFENYGEGINIFGNINGVVIENNTLWDCWAPCIFTPNSQNILISRNLVYQTNDSRFLRDNNPGAGIAFQHEPPPTRPGAVKNITVTNNLVMGCGSNLVFWNDGSGVSIDNILIAHNTFVDAHSNTNSVGSSIFFEDGPYTNIQFKNNLVLQEDNSADFGYSGSTGITFSHNLWYPQIPLLNEMKSANDVTENPLLLKIGATGTGQLTSDYFKINTGSPAVASGTHLLEVTNDFIYNSRAFSPTIGAFENTFPQ